MSFSLTSNPYSNYQAPAFVGMKEDSMDDNVDTFACGNVAINVGVAVQRTGAGALTIKNGAGSLCVGVSLADQLVNYWGTWPSLYASPTAGYQPTQAVSVLTRGRAWVAVSDGTGVADGVACKADATTGQFNTTGTTAVTNAVFRSTAIALYNADFTSSTLAAVVELHNPNV